MVERLDVAVLELAGRLESLGIPYMLIGGYANLVWGEPRLTSDLDVTVEVSENQISDLIQKLQQHYQLLPPDPFAFALETRVIPLLLPSNVRADLILAGLSFEHEAIARAVPRSIGEGTVRVCTAEDLILLKIISDRPRDLSDVGGIIRRNFHELDRSYLDPRVEELATLLERPAIRNVYSQALLEARESLDNLE